MIQHLSVTDIKPELRKKFADSARAKIKAYLANPLLQPEQQALLMKQLSDLDSWEKGTTP